MFSKFASIMRLFALSFLFVFSLLPVSGWAQDDKVAADVVEETAASLDAELREAVNQAEKEAAKADAAAEEAAAALYEEPSMDDKINDFFAPATEVISDIVFYEIKLGEKVSVPFVVVWLMVGAIVSTIYFRFINFNPRKFRLAIDIVRGKYSAPYDKGEVSHFQALTTALSATVGLGNIGGVAIAIGLGGPGATFWMIIAGIFGMSLKFVECTLAVKYRYIDSDGIVRGGPMYYLSQGFADRGFVRLGKVLAGFYALMCVGGALGGGNMYQANQACKQFIIATGGDSSFLANQGWAFGLVMAVGVALVIIGGITGIAKVTAKIVPFMCALYVTSALIVIFMNFGKIPEVVGLIVQGALAPDAMYGGFIGVLIMGMMRAAFSNEAGIGSASIAHSAVRTNNPASEGLVALLEPFIDTVIVCTMTALVIVITGQYEVEGVDGVALTSAAFETAFPWFPVLLSIAVIFFAFSTMIAWSYYGQQAWGYLFGRSKAMDIVYKVIFCGFVIIGSAMTFGNVIGFSDSMIFAMCFPNLIGLYILLPVVKKELNNYLGKIRDGEIVKHD